MSRSDLVLLAVTAAPVLACLAALFLSSFTLLGVRGLRDVTVRARARWPSVAIVMPACNEGATLRASIESLLAQEYPALRLVVIDDRSTDDTGAILDELAARDARIVPVHVTELPDGWLGKLHAMARGVERADAEWLLFADADVQFSPQALQKAVAKCVDEELDMLTAIPEVLPAGFLADATVDVVGLMLASLGRLAQVRDPRAKAYAGIGAFILARRAAFERTPGLAWLRLEVADDVGLGMMMKTHGARCDVVHARGELRIQWYESFRDMTAKMQKNYYAIIARFSLVRGVFAAAVPAGLALFPLVWLVPHGPVVDAWLGAGVLALVIANVACARWMGRPLFTAFFPQVGLLAQAFLVARSTLVGARIGGIVWRDQLYTAELLRDAQRVKM